MVSFRIVAIHDYRTLDMDIVQWLIEEGLNELLTFFDRVKQALNL